jgi:hypothetical protein
MTSSTGPSSLGWFHVQRQSRYTKKLDRQKPTRSTCSVSWSDRQRWASWYRNGSGDQGKLLSSTCLHSCFPFMSCMLLLFHTEICFANYIKKDSFLHGIIHMYRICYLDHHLQNNITDDMLVRTFHRLPLVGMDAYNSDMIKKKKRRWKKVAAFGGWLHVNRLALETKAEASNNV